MSDRSEELRRMVAEATPGPWEVYDPSCGGVGLGITQAGDLPDICVMVNKNDKRRPADAALIAYLRNNAEAFATALDALAAATAREAAKDVEIARLRAALFLADDGCEFLHMYPEWADMPLMDARPKARAALSPATGEAAT